MHVEFKMISVDPGTDTLFKKIDYSSQELRKDEGARDLGSR